MSKSSFEIFEIISNEKNELETVSSRVEIVRSQQNKNHLVINDREYRFDRMLSNRDNLRKFEKYNYNIKETESYRCMKPKCSGMRRN